MNIKNKKICITIITVVFNETTQLEKTINSVISQTYSDVEYIIIDGGSTKPTLDILKKYESKITKIISESDNGIFDAMNKGIDLARGDWINFMNAGDTFVDKDVIKNIAKYLDDAYASVYGNTLIEGKKIKPYPINRFTLSVKSPTCHQSTFFQTNILKKYKFDLINNIGGDPEQLVRLYIDKYKFKYVNLTIADYVLGGFSSVNIIQGYKNKIKYITKHFSFFWASFTILALIKQVIFVKLFSKRKK